ncbi:MAG: YlbF family regulator [Christensenellales bacterium]|jgi:cell fate (sporulation/competence/biofilm development) regulator YlbF (YheA/YmcA/DUF963 family)
MNIYDKAHDLAKALKESEQYKTYEKARELAMENETNKALLMEYKKLQYQLQLQVASGGKAFADDMERYQKLTALLQLSNEATAYMMAEFQLQKTLADIYKILGEAAGIDLDFLQGQ